MSVWRDIWKKSLNANSEMFFNEKTGLKSFEELLNKYKNDGMIYYAKAEAFELKGKTNEAIENYKNAKNAFPVEHWKLIAEKSIEREEKKLLAEKIFNLNDFDDYLWYVFQKVYEFVYIDNFIRYICLSAISRASSEWPLSLIDFRTILELIVNEILSTNHDYGDYGQENLKLKINILQYQGIIKNAKIIAAMHWIRKNGNEATHAVENIKNIADLTSEEKFYELKKIRSFFTLIEFYNNFKKLNRLK